MGYSGFGNRFSDSLTLSMLVVERAQRPDVVLRGTVARPARVKDVARSITAVVPGLVPNRAEQDAARRSR